MSESNAGRSVRVPDHLWEALETMSREMGVPRDALVNQAVFVFARLNGFLTPGAAPQPRPRPASSLFSENEWAPESTSEKSVPPPLRTSTESLRSLFVMAPDGTLDEVDGERYVIGRGSHCDLVINSTKVSREHAVILRESDSWVIEDLESSNGTWFNKERITRRKIADGDEFYICSDKIRCVLG